MRTPFSHTLADYFPKNITPKSHSATVYNLKSRISVWCAVLSILSRWGFWHPMDYEIENLSSPILHTYSVCNRKVALKSHIEWREGPEAHSCHSSIAMKEHHWQGRVENLSWQPFNFLVKVRFWFLGGMVLSNNLYCFWLWHLWEILTCPSFTHAYIWNRDQKKKTPLFRTAQPSQPNSYGCHFGDLQIVLSMEQSQAFLSQACSSIDKVISSKFSRILGYLPPETFMGKLK